MNELQKKEESLLPEDTLLTFESIQTLINQVHQTHIPKDDPMLMIVTINNAYLAAVRELHNKHATALKKFIGENAGQIATSLSGESAKNIKESLKEYIVFKENLKWCTAIIALSALVNVAVICWGLWGKYHG